MLAAGTCSVLAAGWLLWDRGGVAAILVVALCVAVIRQCYPQSWQGPTRQVRLVAWSPAVREASLLAALVLLCVADPWVAVAAGAAAVASSPRLVATLGAAAGRERTMVRARRDQRPRRGRRLHPAGGSLAPSETGAAEAFAAVLRSLEDSELCTAWSRSYAGVHEATGPAELARVAAVRALYLDELARRHPDAMHAWLESGPRPYGDPSNYLP